MASLRSYPTALSQIKATSTGPHVEHLLLRIQLWYKDVTMHIDCTNLSVYRSPRNILLLNFSMFEPAFTTDMHVCYIHGLLEPQPNDMPVCKDPKSRLPAAMGSFKYISIWIIAHKFCIAALRYRQITCSQMRTPQRPFGNSHNWYKNWENIISTRGSKGPKLINLRKKCKTNNILEP